MMHLAFVILSLALGLSTGAKIEMDKETDFGNPNINLNDNFNLNFVSLEETRQDWCAKIYQHWRFNGWEKVVGETSQLDLMGNENDQASSVKVRPGCTLKLFRDPNNVGLLDSLITDFDFLSGYNDQVSSFSCTCQEDEALVSAYVCKEDNEIIEINAESGQLKSPNFPSNYGNNQDCTWVITVPEGFSVILDFGNIFDIEYDFYCKYDFVEVRNWGDETSRFLRKVCGSTSPSTVKSTGNKMFVKFHSNSNVVKKGFSASFKTEALVIGCPTKKDWFDCKSAGCNYPHQQCDGTCIPKSQVNSGGNDCSDGSDEGVIETCEKPKVCCAGDLQECPGMCIEEEYVQNGYPDCYDTIWGTLNPASRDEIGCEDNNNRGTNLLDLVLIPGSTSKKRSACWIIDVDQGVWDQASRDYAGAFCSNWYGWSDGDTNGRISTVFNTFDFENMSRDRPAKGCAKLDFGNCHTSGTVQVYLGSSLGSGDTVYLPDTVYVHPIASTAGRKTVEFEFDVMTRLTIQEENGAIIQINSLDVIPCDGEDDADVRNAGKECFQNCKMQNGPCEWCGPDGWCCRLNRVRNGCDGTFGGANQHQCVLNPGSN